MGSGASVAKEKAFRLSFRQDPRCAKFAKMIKMKRPMSQILVKMRLDGTFSNCELNAFQENLPLKVIYSPVMARFKGSELKKLNMQFMHLAQRSGDPTTITLEEMKEALLVVGISESNTVILKRVFGLMDKTADGQVHFKDFAVTCSAMLSNKVEERLKFSFALYDVNQTGRITKEEMCSVLYNMNATRSWFGERELTKAQANALVEMVFSDHDADKSGSLSYKEYIVAICENPIVAEFTQKTTIGNRAREEKATEGQSNVCGVDADDGGDALVEAIANSTLLI